MSGTTLNATGGIVSDTASQSDVVAAQAIEETAQGITTHEGVVTAPFVFSYNGATMSFLLFQQIIADAGLYAALNASSAAAASITWSN